MPSGMLPCGAPGMPPVAEFPWALPVGGHAMELATWAPVVDALPCGIPEGGIPDVAFPEAALPEVGLPDGGNPPDAVLSAAAVPPTGRQSTGAPAIPDGVPPVEAFELEPLVVELPCELSCELDPELPCELPCELDPELPCELPWELDPELLCELPCEPPCTLPDGGTPAGEDD